MFTPSVVGRLYSVGRRSGGLGGVWGRPA